MFRKKLAVYTGKNVKFKQEWGKLFKIKKMEGKFAYVVSLKRPEEGVCGALLKKNLKVF